jgi:replicative DNA helicase
MGKTAFVLSMAVIWHLWNAVALLSLEMASVQLITFVSSETGLSSEKLRTGKWKNTNGNN